MYFRSDDAYRLSFIGCRMAEGNRRQVYHIFIFFGIGEGTVPAIPIETIGERFAWRRDPHSASLAPAHNKTLKILTL
jgi:hypothetical protein